MRNADTIGVASCARLERRKAGKTRLAVTSPAMTGAVALIAILMAMIAAGAQALDDAKIKELYTAAKKEGQVIIWGTQRREVEWIPAAFGKVFPGIDVQFLGDNDIAVK